MRVCGRRRAHSPCAVLGLVGLWVFCPRDHLRARARAVPRHIRVAKGFARFHDCVMLVRDARACIHLEAGSATTLLRAYNTD